MVFSFKARQVLDSRGRHTIQAEINGFTGTAPSGASTGSHELPEQRGKNGFQDQVTKINLLKPQAFSSLSAFDEHVGKLGLGSSASTALSFAAARAFANQEGLSLWKFLSKTSNSKPKMPFLQFNVLNGGKHAGLENDFQEHMYVAKHKTFVERVFAGASVYSELKSALVKSFGARGALVADEGGFAPQIGTLRERFKLIEKAAQNAGQPPLLALDAAASEFYDGKIYSVDNKAFTASELAVFYSKIAGDFQLDSIEDGLAEDDWAGWVELNRVLGKKMLIIGDDLLVTQKSRVLEAASKTACNALLVKPNQVGSVSLAIEAVSEARRHGMKIVVSHRSGETEDPFIAHLAVGLGADYTKFGAPCRSERLAKYNELLKISEEL